MPFWLCLAVCILVAVSGACMTAGISLVFGVPVFIGSMCIRYAFSGVLTTITQQQTIFLSHQQYGFMNNTTIKAVVLFLFILIGYYLYEYTSLGKNNRAIGGNIVAARQAGVRTKKNIFIAFIILGICVGTAAIFQMFRNGEVTSQSGAGLEFNMMMAIVLGGFPMRGGDTGRISSAIIGALTVTILVNGLTLWGVDARLVNGVNGLLFVVIVALSYDRSMGKLVS
jgi:ribose transport system permease protein